MTALLDALEPKHRRVLRLRYGLIDGCPRTLRMMAKELGISYMTVRQCEREALNEFWKLVRQLLMRRRRAF
jgi:RNA polymerase primary sigma factor